MKRLIILFLLSAIGLYSQSIEDKKAGSLPETPLDGMRLDEHLLMVNQKLSEVKTLLEREMAKASALVQEGADESNLQAVFKVIQGLRQEKQLLEKRWRLAAVHESKQEDEGYGLWDQEETTLSSLVMEYGSSDYLYIVPHDLSAMKVTMHSNIPIPRESWSEALEIILNHNGVGIKGVNTFTKQLYVLKQDPSAVSVIASRPEEIAYLDESRRIFYIFSPPVEQAKSAFGFFEKFSDPKRTFVYHVGGKVAIVAVKEEIEKLLQLYHTIWQDPNGKISKVVPVTKMHVKEMEKILQTFFNEALEKPQRPPFAKFDNEGLSIMTPQQGNSLVLMGRKELVDRAEKLVHDTQSQLQDPAEMTIYIYNVKHSDPADLAKVLDKVYISLFSAIPDYQEGVNVDYSAKIPTVPPDGYAQAPGLTVPPQRFKPEVDSKLEVEQSIENFIPDVKTGNILMVVRKDILPRIKDLLHRLDIPKRMVQIEVLLFEKKINNQANYGLNLLRLGNAENGARYDGPNVTGPMGLDAPVGTGVLAFLFTGEKSKNFPAFDIAYSFLMTQEDIQLNAAPSVITVNQTPATISILEEISLNNGAAPIDTNKGIAFEKSFTRAQYGINIILTPIIHLPDEIDACEFGDHKGFVTLQTNITFDTTKPAGDNMPRVDRRHIENEVRVYDGQTVILGGLRRKSVRDTTQKVPFLGEIPGFGKLFGSTELSDDNTEMFFFITPKIVSHPKEELLYMRCKELERRPGDIPEFLCKLVEARECEKKELFANSIRTFFGERHHYYYED